MHSNGMIIGFQECDSEVFAVHMHKIVRFNVT